MRYPMEPGYKTTGPSAEAAKAVLNAPTLRNKTFACIQNSQHGLTADECAERMNRSPFSIRPRVSELKQSGRIFDTGERRKTSMGKPGTVWAVKKGEE
jgi:predicted ArsR family transcriptional regulator